MKNKKIINIIIVLIIITSVSLIYYLNKDKKHYVKIDGAYIAITVDGEEQEEFPSRGNYKINYSCINGRGLFLTDEWKLRVTNITGNVKCNLSFTTNANPDSISTTISNLVNTTSSQTDWKVLSENGIRYEGANPDNYVWFNNELWRIIGVFDVETEDGTTQKLTKIIRNDPINNLAWDGNSSGYKNFWSQSTLYKLLNPVSGDANSGAYYNGVDNNTYCYGYGTYKKGDCNFSADGITSASYRNMIAKVVWKFGGMSNSTSSNWTAPNIYTAEQGTHVHSSNSSYGTPEVLNYIGLMYASDFGYSALGCSRTTSMNLYSSCIANAWLYTPYAWTLSPYSYNSYVFFVNLSILNGSGASSGYAVRPSLYLKSNVYIAGGSGAPSDPYIIKEA